MSGLEIQLPGATILGQGDELGARPGLYVAEGGWQGWDDATAIRRDASPRPTSHGQYDLPVLQGVRVPSIEGWALAKSEFELGRLRSLVTGVGADGDRFRVVVKHQGEVLWAFARISGTPTFRDSGVRRNWLWASFNLEMVCADPRKYGEPHSFSGSSVTAYQYGNFPASPVVEVAGPVTGPYTITGPGGRQFTVTQSLTAGQVHRIDFRTGRVFRDGSLQVGAVSKAELWTVPANSQAAMSIDKGSMTVTVTDTYM